MVDSIETRPTHPNALAKRLYAERFFDSGSKVAHVIPKSLIIGHEQWLTGELEKCGLSVDDRTWSHFYDNAINRSLDQKVAHSTGRLEAQTFQSTGNILQALAWYHCPEGASWQIPEIILKPASSIFTDHERFVTTAKTGKRINSKRWMGPMEKHKSDLVGFGNTNQDKAEFIFQVNEHYEGVQGWLRRKNGPKMHGIKCEYDSDTNIFKVSFANPNDFMGWESRLDEGKWVEEDQNKLVYRLEYLDQFLADLVRAVSEKQEGAIAIETWRAY